MIGFVWGSGHSFVGKPVFQEMKVGLEGMGCFSVLWVLGVYSEFMSMSLNLNI